MSNKRFYSLSQWRKLRLRRLRKDSYLCQECRRYGRTTPATHVHHIFPLETHWELRYNILNLISLCNTCHENMHDRYTREITDVGKRWQEKVKNELCMTSPL